MAAADAPKWIVGLRWRRSGGVWTALWIIVCCATDGGGVVVVVVVVRVCCTVVCACVIGESLPGGNNIKVTVYRALTNSTADPSQ